MAVILPTMHRGERKPILVVNFICYYKNVMVLFLSLLVRTFPIMTGKGEIMPVNKKFMF